MRGQGGVSLHRASGLWKAQISLGWVDGKRQRPSSYHQTRAEAEAWVVDQLALLRRGGRLPSRLLLGDWLAEWLRLEARSVAPKQVAEDRTMVARMPAWLTGQAIGGLTTNHVQTWLDSIEGSPRWVAIHRNRLRKALNDAMRRDLIDRNPAKLAEPPRQRRPRRVVITAEEARAILAATDGWRYHAAVALALGTGVRQGELLGLTWADVRADRIVVRQRLRREQGEFVVVTGTKTDDSDVRTVPLPIFARVALDEWKLVQDAERRAAGDNVDPLDRSVPVFTTETGRHVHGSVLTHGFADRLNAAGLTHRSWYDLRHATTDILAARGIAQTAARDYVGHASVVTTADHYTGTAWAELAAAGDALDQAVGG